MKLDVRNYKEVYVGTDFHAGHDKPFIWEARGFSDLRQHDITLNNELDTKLNRDSCLIYLGD